MNNVEELHDGCAVVCNGSPSILVDEQEITSVWAKCALDGCLYRQTCVDI